MTPYDVAPIREEVELASTKTCGRGLRFRLRELQERTFMRLAAFGLVLLFGIMIGALTLIVFGKLADDVMENETTALDSAASVWVRQFRSPENDVLMRGLSLMGGQLLPVVLLPLLAVVALRRSWTSVLSLVVVVCGAQVLNSVLKAAFQRERPTPFPDLFPAQQFSFPSGHAMVAAAVYLYLAYLGWPQLRGFARYAVVASLALVVVLVGLSRLYFEVHYVTDVIAGILAGAIWTDAVIVVGRILKSPWHDLRTPGTHARC